MIEVNKRNVVFAILLVLALIAAICMTSCLTIPEDLESSIHDLHKGSILICEDYVELVDRYHTLEDAQEKLKLVRQYLLLSKEVDDYVEGKGGKYEWIWTTK